MTCFMFLAESGQFLHHAKPFGITPGKHVLVCDALLKTLHSDGLGNNEKILLIKSLREVILQLSSE